MFKKLVLSLATLFTIPAFASGPQPVFRKSVELDPHRLVMIVGEVDGRAAASALRIQQLAEASNDPIYLFINSPGGYVDPGLSVLQAMIEAKAKGIQVVCATSGMAASMAFYILGECSQRYAIKTTRMLWHPIKTYFYGPQPSEVLFSEAMSMSLVEMALTKKLQEALNIDPELYAYHRIVETWWSAEHLILIAPQFLTLVDEIRGIGVLPKFMD